QLEIHQAALAGWDTNQFAQYLRSQPTYSQGTEAQSKALSFMQALGLITGGTPVYGPTFTTPGSGTPGGSPALPNSKLAPAAPATVEGPFAGWGVGLSGPVPGVGG